MIRGSFTVTIVLVSVFVADSAIVNSSLKIKIGERRSAPRINQFAAAVEEKEDVHSMRTIYSSASLFATLVAFQPTVLR